MTAETAAALAGDRLRVLPDDEHNRRLVEHAHPPGWSNPTPEGRYNMVVVGGGTAGLVTAAATAGLGGKVALIERHLLGGDCLNVGCVPSKGIIRVGRAMSAARRAATFGISLGEARLDFAAAMERLRRVRADIAREDSAARFAGLGVEVYLGHARFIGPDQVEVDGRKLRFARALIATGSAPAAPPIEGLAEAGYLTNENLFELTELPARLAVIGGGPIGCELAQTFARLGSRVTLLEREPGILPRDDPAAAAVVAAALERDGVALRTGASIERVEPGRTVIAGGERIEADAILVATGRRPTLDDLGLEAAGVERDEGGLVIDDRLRTTNRRIYAAGDAASELRFTHAADAMARLVVKNALFFGRSRARDLIIPWVTYTDPELAHVGLTAAAAAEAGIDIDTYEIPMADIHRAALDGATEGFFRVHCRAGTGRIAGATLVSEHAGESIGEIVLAMTTGAGLAALSRTIHPYPTQAQALKRAADAYTRSRLTPFIARLLRWFLARRR